MGREGFGHNSNFLPKIWSRPRLASFADNCGSRHAPACKSLHKCLNGICSLWAGRDLHPRRPNGRLVYSQPSLTTSVPAQLIYLLTLCLNLIFYLKAYYRYGWSKTRKSNCGATCQIRTDDIHFTKVALYQLS